MSLCFTLYSRLIRVDASLGRVLCWPPHEIYDRTDNALKIDRRINPRLLQPAVGQFLDLAGGKITRLADQWDPGRGTPVFTVGGRYSTRGWTEWTQGFQYGCAILQFDMTGDERFLEIGRAMTIERMAPHVSHVGVHDHGFNNLSTYGNLRRLMTERRIPFDPAELDFYELALKVSGAVQAARWSTTADGGGYIYSFNGPQSLFSDTMRSLRSLVVAHQLGHALMAENDCAVNLQQRAVEHAMTTLQYNVYYGAGRDAFDVPGRVAHESIFNVADGNYRCPSTQQGYSPFSTWTRGLAWILCGCAEQLEYLARTKTKEWSASLSKARVVAALKKAAVAVAEFHIRNSFADGIPFWDTGAPGVAQFGDIRLLPSDPHNDIESLDSSAAAICAQGYLRLGNYLMSRGDHQNGTRYRSAAWTIAQALFSEPYLSTDPRHQGLLLHSIYHNPNGWDHIPRGRKIACGESSMWGDYHAMELALMTNREAENEPYPRFFS